MFELLWLLGIFLFCFLVALLAKKFGVNYLIGLYVALMITIVSLGSKLIYFFGFQVNVGFLLISATLLLSDIVAEFFGEKKAFHMVWIGLIGIVFFMLTSLLAVFWPATPFYQNQEAYRLIFGLSIRMSIAQLVTNLITQNQDVLVFSLIKKMTKGKKLWLRNNVSTITTQLCNTVLFYVIAFYGVYDIWPIIVQSSILKIFVSLLDTPFIYLTKIFYKKM